MASGSYRGRYVFRYSNGLFMYPVFDIDFEAPYIDVPIPEDSVINASLYSCKNGSTTSNMGETLISGNMYLNRNPSGRVLNWGFYKNTTLIRSMDTGNYDGFTIPVICIDRTTNDYYLAPLTLYFSNVPNLYEIAVTYPQIGEAGFATIVFNTDRSFAVTSAYKITDPDLLNVFINGTPYTPDDDPYSGDDGSDDPSGPSGGEGDEDNWDPDSDPNPVPDLPNVSAVDTGFITLYNPTIQQLKNLANYMWSGLFDIDTFKRIMADPMDAILGLSIVPVAVPGGTSTSVKVGNVDTGVSMYKASSQYVKVDCGTVTLPGKWNSYLDYSPYCKVSIVLPYVGSYELDIDQLRGKSENTNYSIGCIYSVDILSGACVAFVTVNGSVIGEYPGQCSISIPITSRNFADTIQSISTLVSTGAMLAVTGGMSAPMSAAMIAGAVTASANTAANVMGSKQTIAKSGNLSSANGLLAIQTPYLIVERPKLCAPKFQNMYTGYPSYITRTLSELSGFTQIQDIQLKNISCTDEERDEILSILRRGVIL